MLSLKIFDKTLRKVHRTFPHIKHFTNSTLISPKVSLFRNIGLSRGNSTYCSVLKDQPGF